MRDVIEIEVTTTDSLETGTVSLTGKVVEEVRVVFISSKRVELEGTQGFERTTSSVIRLGVVEGADYLSDLGTDSELIVVVV